MNSFGGSPNFVILFGIALGIAVIGLILFVLSRFFKKDNEITKVDTFLKSGNYKKALNIAQKYMNDNPNDFMLKYYIAQAYEGLRNYTAAVGFYEKASIAASLTGHQEIKTSINIKAASLYQKLGRPKEALGYYVLVLEKNPKNIKALYEISDLLYQMKNYKKAKDYLENLLKVKPENFRARFLLGKAYYQLNDYNSANSHLSYITKNIKNDKVFLNKVQLLLSDVKIKLKQYDEAVNLLTPFLSSPEHIGDVLIKIIDTLIKGKKVKKAIEIANQYIDRVDQVQKAKIMYHLGNAYFKLSEIFKALNWWKKAYSTNPMFTDLKDTLKSHAMILNNPKMEFFFSTNASIFGKFVMSMLKVHKVSDNVRKDAYWIVKSGDDVHIVYRKPFAMTCPELDELERLLRQDLVSNLNVVVYSLYGLNDKCSNKFLIQQVEVVKEKDLVKLVNATSTN